MTWALGASDNAAVAIKKTDGGSKKKRKSPALFDFQLFDIDQSNATCIKKILGCQERSRLEPDRKSRRIAAKYSPFRNKSGTL
jgi:hypothetical protein